MKKISLFTLLSLATVAGAKEPVALSQFLAHDAATLDKGAYHVDMAYLRINDTLDIFNLKQKELKSIGNKYGAIGDLKGYEFNGFYGVTDKNMLLAKASLWNIDYSDTLLKNRHLQLAWRYRFATNFSCDGGVIYDGAKDLAIANENLINATLHKIKPDTSYKIENGAVVADDDTITFYDKNNNIVHPTINITDMRSKSLFLRLAMGGAIGNRSRVSSYFKVRRNYVSSSIGMGPAGQNSFYDKQILSKVHPKDLKRVENMVAVGASYGLRLGDFTGELHYEYNKFFRPSDVSYLDTNHILEASLSYDVTKHITLFSGAKAMLHQFMTDLPYLYNRYTQTQFDKKYGFVRFGVSFH